MKEARTSTHAPQVIPSILNSLFSERPRPLDSPSSSSVSGSPTLPSVACASPPARNEVKKADMAVEDDVERKSAGRVRPESLRQKLGVRLREGGSSGERVSKECVSIA